jgi:hypothetical protein
VVLSKRNKELIYISSFLRLGSPGCLQILSNSADLSCNRSIVSAREFFEDSILPIFLP